MVPVDPLTASFYEAHGRASAERWETISSTEGVAPFFDDAFEPSSRLLDIGCGSGRDLAALRAMGHDVFGVEPSEALRARCVELHPELDGRVIAGGLPDAIDLPNGWPASFDGLVCSAVLMHVPRAELPAAMEMVCGLLVPGGRLLISLPSRRPEVADDRDPAGRLFTGVTSEEVTELGAPFGLTMQTLWADRADAQGREGNVWEVALFEQEG